MSYHTRAYDNDHGDPVVVLVATGTHDVSRLVNLLNGDSPNSEQRRLADVVVRQIRRHNAGRAALRLLRDHGGPDFTEAPAAERPTWPRGVDAARWLRGACSSGDNLWSAVTAVLDELAQLRAERGAGALEQEVTTR